LPSLTEFRAFEAAISGQGIAILSDALIGPELANGALVAISRITLWGYGFYIVLREWHPKLAHDRVSRGLRLFPRQRTSLFLP
jgi:LysR family glycine cleavage system transcriptional activator